MPHVLYDGPSLIDGKPVIALATGITSPSNNPKTGPMVQTWILRKDLTPVEAIKNGADYSICGNCKHRGVQGRHRSCYVQVHQAPTAVFNSKSFIKPESLSALGAKRAVRIGAYGDPTAVPYEIWDQLTSLAHGFTGYTHLWSNCDERFKKLLMASVDTPEEMQAAQSKGWRTFRVKTDAAPTEISEVYCPADSDQSKQCINCLLCSGNKLQGKHVVINSHGAQWKIKQFKILTQAA